MSTRKPSQVIAVDNTVIVLADDKTLWRLWEGGWVQIPDLPQPEQKEQGWRQEPKIADMD
jgi:hypothetical protein